MTVRPTRRGRRADGLAKLERRVRGANKGKPPEWTRTFACGRDVQWLTYNIVVCLYVYIRDILSVRSRKFISRLPIDISTLVQFADTFPFRESVVVAGVVARFQQRKPSVETVLSSRYYNINTERVQIMRNILLYIL